MDLRSTFIDVTIVNQDEDPAGGPSGLIISDHATGAVLYNDPDFSTSSDAASVDQSFTFNTPSDWFVNYTSQLTSGPNVFLPSPGTYLDQQTSGFGWSFTVTAN